jgi:hypothetical protein
MRKRLFHTLSFSALFLALFAGIAMIRFGSFGATVAAANGLPLYLSQGNTRTVKAVRDGEVVVAVFELKNLTSRTITIYGASVDCRCNAVSRLPLSIGPRGSGTIEMRVQTNPSDTGKSLTRGARLFHDGGSQQVVLILRIEQIEPVGSTNASAQEEAAAYASRLPRRVRVFTQGVMTCI